MAATTLKIVDGGGDDEEISILCTAPAVFKSGAINSTPKLTIDLTQNDDEDDDVAEGPLPSSSNSKRDDTVFSRSFTCEICAADKPISDSFLILGCGHLYCTRCVSDYVAAKVRENITGIKCPSRGCDGYLEPDHCRTILPRAVFERWGDALCEAMILEEEKLHCPFNDCSALLIDDGREKLTPQLSECPECRRLFCVTCKGAWHEGSECKY